MIGVAAAGVMALGAQPATAVVKYDTKLTLVHLENDRVYHGRVYSEVGKCEPGRKVVLFRQDRGADTRLGKDRSFIGSSGPWGQWWILGRPEGRPVYAKVRPKERDRFVCRADRSPSWTYE